MESNEEKFRINVTQIKDLISNGCGYCKHQSVKLKTRFRNQLLITTKSIPIDIYQNLVEKGWSRCGNRLYKKNYEKSCCKLYQPRVNVNNFKITKHQKKVMKKFRKYLTGEYELNKLSNKINNKDIKEKEKEKKVKEEDEIQNKIDEKLREYITSSNFLDINL